MARILILDDDQPFLEAQVEFLTSLGHTVFSGPTGRNCVELIALHKVDLLITDLVMPEQDGLQVIREVHKRLPKVKIIAMSGGGRLVSSDFLVVASKIGADEILDKPFTFAQLQDAIKKVL